MITTNGQIDSLVNTIGNNDGVYIDLISSVKQQIFSTVDQNLIEGVSNDVLLFGLATFFSIIVLIYQILKRYENLSRFSYRIHPSNEAAVTQTRQHQNILQSDSGVDSSQAFNLGSHSRRYGQMEGNCPICLNQFYLPVETNCGHLFCAQCVVVYWQHAQWRGGPIKCPVCRQQVNILLNCFSLNNIPVQSSQASPPLSPTVGTSTEAATESALPSSNSSASPSTSSSSSFTSLFSSSSSSSTSLPPSDSANNEELNNSRNRAQSIIREINTYNRRFSGQPRPWFDYLYDLPTLLRHLSNDFFSFSGLMYIFRIRVVICFMAAIMYLISPLDMIPEAVFGIFGLIDDIVVILLVAVYVTIIYRSFLSSRWQNE